MKGSHTGIQFANDRVSSAKEVTVVQPGSPAWFAGVQTGDVITAVNASDLTTSTDDLNAQFNLNNIAEVLGGEQGSKGARIGTSCKLTISRSLLVRECCAANQRCATVSRRPLCF